MPISNKSNKSNKSSNSSSDPAAAISEAALSAAIAATYDGVIASQSLDDKEVSQNRPRLQTSNDATGLINLLTLDSEWRQAVLLGLVLEGLVVEGSAKGAIVKFQAGGKSEELLRIIPPSENDLREQLRLVRAYADLRAERLIEINVQLTEIVPFFGAVDRLSPRRCPCTLELLDLAATLCTIVVQRVKHLLGCARPIDFSSQIQPVIATPTHSTLPSGHATEAFATASMLCRLVDGVDGVGSTAARQRYRVAARIAANRTVAGVHFPIDSAAGAMLGVTLADWLAAIAGNEECSRREFDGTRFKGDFHYKTFVDLSVDARKGKLEHRPEVSDLLKALWNHAGKEWGR